MPKALLGRLAQNTLFCRISSAGRSRPNESAICLQVTPASRPRSAGREKVLFIGTQFSNLNTALDTPAGEAA